MERSGRGPARRGFRSGHRDKGGRLLAPLPEVGDCAEMKNVERVESSEIGHSAGHGILHAGYQLGNPATQRQAQRMVDRFLRSFRLVNRPLTPDELAALSQHAR